MLLVAHRTPADAGACSRLAAAGANVFEVDIQLAGERIVVSHWFPLRRTRRLEHDGWRLRRHTSARRDPTIADLAAAVPPDRDLLLDLKERIHRPELVAALGAAVPDKHRFVAGGPHPEDLEQLRMLGFRTWRTIGSSGELAAVLGGSPLADEAVSIRHTLVTAESLRRLRPLVPSVVAWTVNDPARARALSALGVTGLTTDRLAILRDYAG